MENLKFKEYPSPNDGELTGRERVPVTEAVAIQMKLIEDMTPPELTQYIEADNSAKIMDNLAMRWQDKYAGKFAEYCNLNKNNQILMYKLTHNELADQDFRSIREFLEQSSEDDSGGPFFTPDELQEFMKQNSLLN